ncbi:hypothetical protein ACFQU7_20315 [Pseudoroseomonas wenyumeiae]
MLDADFGGPIEHGVPAVIDLPLEKPPSWFGALGLLAGAGAALVLGTFGLGLALMLRDLFAASPCWAGWARRWARAPAARCCWRWGGNGAPCAA